jgi:hypothetical protein
LQRLQAHAALIFFFRLSAILCAVCAWSASAAPFSAGASEQTVDVAGTSLQVYAYKPPAYDGGPILVVLHGLGRNAAGNGPRARSAIRTVTAACPPDSPTTRRCAATSHSLSSYCWARPT